MKDTIETLRALALTLLHICGAWLLVRGAVWLTEWMVHGLNCFVP